MVSLYILRLLLPPGALQVADPGSKILLHYHGAVHNFTGSSLHMVNVEEPRILLIIDDLYADLTVGFGEKYHVFEVIFECPQEKKHSHAWILCVV